MCAAGVADCDDTAGETDGEQDPVVDAFDDAAMTQAQELLGLTRNSDRTSAWGVRVSSS